MCSAVGQQLVMERMLFPLPGKRKHSSDYPGTTQARLTGTKVVYGCLSPSSLSQHSSGFVFPDSGLNTTSKNSENLQP